MTTTKTREQIREEKAEQIASINSTFDRTHRRPLKQGALLGFDAGAAYERERVGELIARAHEITWINQCRCDEVFTSRGMHESNALCGEMDEFIAALKALEGDRG